MGDVRVRELLHHRRRVLARGRGSTRPQMTAESPARRDSRNEFWQRVRRRSDIVGKTLTLEDVPISWWACRSDSRAIFPHGRDVFVPLERYPPLRDASLDNVSPTESRVAVHHGRLSPGVDLPGNAPLRRSRHSWPRSIRRRTPRRPACRCLSPERHAHRTQFLLFQTVALLLTGNAPGLSEHLRHDAGPQRDA